MQTAEVKMSQREEVACKLLEIVPNISVDDKRAFLNVSKHKKSTLWDYLKGNVANIDLGTDMLLFFRERIAEREKVTRELLEIVPNISVKDKRAFCQKFKFAKSMLSDYLCGRVYRLDKANEMLLFFRSRIAERDKLINAV